MRLWDSVLAQADLKQPQRKFLSELTELMLMVPGSKTFRNLSRYSHYHEKSIERQFSQSCDWVSLNRTLIESVVPADHEQALILDASFIRKSGRQSYGLDRFWNGCASRSERGLEISTLACLDLSAHQAYSLSVEQTSACDGTVSSADDNRIDQYIEQVRCVVKAQPSRSLRHLITDGYYSKKRFVDAVVELELSQIGKLRSDANMRYLYQGQPSPGPGRRKTYDGKVDWSDLSRFDVYDSGEESIELYQCSLHHKQFKRVLNVVVVVDRRRTKPRQVILFSTDLALSAQTLYRYYRARFLIEFLFRDGKQFCGLNDCQARSKEKLHYHFNASLCAANVARLEARQPNTSGQAQRPLSMASLQRQTFNQHLLDCIIDNLDSGGELKKFNPVYQSLCNYGSISQMAA